MKEQMPNPEEIKKIEKERFQSDKELLFGGAKFTGEKAEDARLELTPEQIEKAREEMKGELNEQSAIDDKHAIEKLSGTDKEVFELMLDFSKEKDEGKVDVKDLVVLYKNRIDKIDKEIRYGRGEYFEKLASREYNRRKEKIDLDKK